MTLTAEQQSNARLILAISRARQLPDKAAVIGIATAMQESGLRNLSYGDRDSVGLFQQRPSMGWGTIEQCRNPTYATNKFFDALVKVPGWQSLPVTVAAQAVQRSAFPNAYAKHESMAVALVNGSSANLAQDVNPIVAGDGFYNPTPNIQASPPFDWAAAGKRLLQFLAGILLVVIALIRLTGTI